MIYIYSNADAQEIELNGFMHRMMEVYGEYRYPNSMTNSEVRIKCKMGCDAGVIGYYMAELRKLKLVNYHFLTTGRKANGSGRYCLEVLGQYIVSIEGEMA